MCLGIPGRVVEFVDESHHLARVEVSGVRRVVNVGLVLADGLQPGDWVLIHVGFALSKIDEAEAQRTTELLQQLGAAWEQELQQLSESEIA
jgi:hydrogenase expression/formation protein HypC